MSLQQTAHSVAKRDFLFALVDIILVIALVYTGIKRTTPRHEWNRNILLKAKSTIERSSNTFYSGKRSSFFCVAHN
jgi:hypothetical protein